jgi:uncharacterized iron-regulated membrane protein
MAFFKDFWKRPQNVWLRRAMFQIHLWTGIGIGLYVLAISLSGSAIVFRNEIYKSADTGPRIVEVKGAKLSEDALKAEAMKLYPGSTVSFVWPGKQPNHATEIWLDLDGKKKQRLFDPYTGQDLGPAIPYAIQITAWFINLHTDLLAGETGRKLNGWASALFTLLCVTGAIVWWPGVDKWKRSLWVNPKSGWRRINWDLHSAVGAWTFLLVFMWAATGVFLVWPTEFQRVIHRITPLLQYAPPDESLAEAAAPAVVAQADAAPKGFGKGKGRRAPPPRTKGDIFVRWLYYLHFGNFAGWKVKALWTALGLLPVLLLVTGTIMWWNRVLCPSARKARRNRTVPSDPVPAADI